MADTSALIPLIRAYAHHLVTVDPDDDLHDLNPLARIAGDARIVALGESTHGTREFFLLRHRMIRFLVTELGFTLVGIEAGWPECLAINAYVMDGVGDPAAALAQVGYWIWDTEEFRAVIEWLREHNAPLPRNRRVQVFGFDAAFAPIATKTIYDYLAVVDPVYANSIMPLRDAIGAVQPWELPENGRIVSKAIEALRDRLLAEQADYAAASSPGEWTIAYRCVETLHQVDGRRRASDDALQFTVRDTAMASNVSRQLNQAGSAAKAVVLAHNGHVTRDIRGLFDPSITTMGQDLSGAYNDDFVTIGFAFGQGGFQAIVDDQSDNARLDAVTVGPPPSGSLDAILMEISHGPALLLDLRALSSNLREWLGRERISREVGAVFSGAGEMHARVFPGARYDAIAFVRHTSRARPTPTGVRPYRLTGTSSGAD